MEFETFVSIGLAFAVPAVVSFLKNSAWSKMQRMALAVVVALAASTGALFVQGELNSFADFAANGAIVWAGATANYKLWFGNTDLNLKLEAMRLGGSRPEV